MRVIFAGTPEFAARALAAIAAAGHEIPLVLTQPDRPAGRGQRPAESAVKALAAQLGFPLYQPEKLRADAERAPLFAVSADVMVVAAYGLLLPQAVLDHPLHGCLNIHASLLPRWRGAAPIQRSLLAGDAETGVCIMKMDAGLDTGPVVSRHVVAIGNDDTAGVLHDKLAATGAAAIVDALALLAEHGRLPEAAQPADGNTYAPKITKDEARIDWSRAPAAIVRQIRAYNPVPGAHTTAAGTVLKIWTACAVPEIGRSLAPGELALLDDALHAGCGNGNAIRLDEVQGAGSRRMQGALWARGRPDLAGLRLGT